MRERSFPLSSSSYTATSASIDQSGKRVTRSLGIGRKSKESTLLITDSVWFFPLHFSFSLCQIGPPRSLFFAPSTHQGFLRRHCNVRPGDGSSQHTAPS